MHRVPPGAAPTFCINGNPGQTGSVTRNLERDAGRLLGFDVYVGPNGGTNRITKALTDYAEQDLLHMITADPNRTPNFILFANPDYFFLPREKHQYRCARQRRTRRAVLPPIPALPGTTVISRTKSPRPGSGWSVPACCTKGGSAISSATTPTLVRRS
jgi:hypothetical protein